MSVSLDPIVAGKLKHFGRRRLRLIIARGLCAGLVTFLLCMAVVAAIDKTCAALQTAVADADTQIKTKAWNDKKISAHHAIIPTRKSMDGSRLSGTEANIYELIARQYLAQFYPPFEYLDKQIDTEVCGGLFIARQKDILAQGWKVLFPTAKSAKTKTFDNSGNTGEKAETDSEGFLS